MKFSMKLLPPLAAELNPSFGLEDQAPTEIRELLFVGCGLLDQNQYQFVVSGFDVTPWPTDVRYDLHLVLEQLPTTLSRVRRGQAATLDFFGQGLERIVDLAPLPDSMYELRCRSGMSWHPTFDKETRRGEDIVDDMEQLSEAFADGLRKVSPELRHSQALVDWIALTAAK